MVWSVSFLLGGLALLSPAVAMKKGTVLPTRPEIDISQVKPEKPRFPDDHPTAEEKEFWNGTCGKLMKRNGFNQRGFAKIAAHGTHSMEPVDVMKYFNREAKYSPMKINPDLSADDGLVDQKKVAYKPKEEFKSAGMNAVNRVLSRMDDEDYLVRSYTTLEKVVHQMHMEELWTETQPEYLKFNAKHRRMRPSTQQLCKCVNNVEANGVKRELGNMKRRLDALEASDRLSYGLSYRLSYTLSYGLSFGFESVEMPHITDAKSWGVWRDSFKNQDPAAHGTDLAGYVWCSTNYAKA